MSDRTTPPRRILLTADPMLPVPPVHYGGIERIVDALARAYRKNGHTVGLVARAGSTAAVDALFPWPAPAAAGALATWRHALTLRQAADAFRPDVIHSFSRLAYLGLMLRRGIPLVMSYQRHTGGRQIGWAARLAGPRLQFTGCSEFICGMGRRAGGHWTAIPNFVEPEKFTFARDVATDAPLVFLSRIEPIKGPELAIAIARGAGRRLLIAGNRSADAAHREFWDKAIAPHLGRNGVEYVGEVDDLRKNALLSEAAALLVPIQWDEPFGIVFAEALGCGTPVLTCRRGATPEIVIEGRTGLFVENVEQGVAAVARLASLDRDACRQDVLARFSVETCSAQYLTLFQQLLTRAPA